MNAMNMHANNAQQAKQKRIDKIADNLQKLSVVFQKHTTFFQKAYYLFSKSILPFWKEVNSSKKRAPCLNTI